jgi:Transposase DDE domain
MHHRIDTILTALRQDIGRHLDADSICSACRSIGHTWRKCQLDPVAIVHWFVIQILHCNTALAHIALLGDRRFTDSAYCQARARLPLAVLQAVLRNLVKSLTPDTQTEGLWRGHRTLLIDGSGLSMPDTPALQTAFGQPGGQTRGCGFPVAKILALFHAGTGVLLKVIATPLRSHDMASVGAIPAELKPNDVLVGDRGFCSFAHIAMLVQGGFHAVFRIHQKQIVDFTPNRPHTQPGEKGKSEGRPRSRWLRRLGVLDQVVEWSKPRDRPGWMTVEDYAKLRVRPANPFLQAMLRSVHGRKGVSHGAVESGRGQGTVLAAGPDAMAGEPAHDSAGVLRGPRDLATVVLLVAA